MPNFSSIICCHASILFTPRTSFIGTSSPQIYLLMTSATSNYVTSVYRELCPERKEISTIRRNMTSLIILLKDNPKDRRGNVICRIMFSLGGIVPQKSFSSKKTMAKPLTSGAPGVSQQKFLSPLDSISSLTAAKSSTLFCPETNAFPYHQEPHIRDRTKRSQ